MILVDLNQVIYSGLMAQIAGKKKLQLQEDLIRHMVLNILRGHIKKFKAEYGEVVLCCDNRKYWRREIFPFYKAGRKKSREKSDLDWQLIFEMMNKFKIELKENFPYKTIEVENAEADDIIGTLAPRYVNDQDILILSSDGDFLQLQKYNKTYKVKQYNPTTKKFMVSEDALLDLKEKIIRGDKGDGIPNILSPGDTFVKDLRQKVLSEEKMKHLLANRPEDFKDDIAKTGFSRNQMLIDLTFIPSEIRENIINTYENTKVAPRSQLINYFVDKKLRNLIGDIGDF